MGVLICILFITQILSLSKTNSIQDELESSPLFMEVMWAFIYPCVSRR